MYIQISGQILHTAIMAAYTSSAGHSNKHLARKDCSGDNEVVTAGFLTEMIKSQSA